MFCAQRGIGFRDELYSGMYCGPGCLVSGRQNDQECNELLKDIMIKDVFYFVRQNEKGYAVILRNFVIRDVQYGRETL
jgi:hypothetical protein